ncbi:MAG TPA: hypothetical protein VF119_05950 [Candidatus Limnocylindrales bacterium]
MRSIAGALSRYRLLVLTSTVVAAAILTWVAMSVSGRPLTIGHAVSIGLMLVGGLGFTLVGSLILDSKPGHRIGRLMVVMGLSLVISLGIQSSIEALDPDGVRWWGTEVIRAIAEAIGVVGLLGGVIIVAWFPDGRATSRLGSAAQTLVAIVLLSEVADVLIEGFLDETFVPFVLIVAAYAVALADLLTRYRVADGVRRTQIRWVLASGAVSALVIVIVVAFGDQLWWLYGVWIASTILPAVAVGIAITRYHLYEIDRIISRTLTYAGVTISLFALFVVANLIAQWALSPFTDGNAIAVAGSTLIAAAAFTPLRSRLQAVVDRRFNRGRYDAQRTIDSFAGRLRDELDLATLAGALQQTTRAAVEPASTAVWLRGGASR